MKMEQEIANYMEKYIPLDFKYYFFLCSETWCDNNRINIYKGLWNDNFLTDYLIKYKLSREEIFLNKDKLKFVTLFEIDRKDLFPVLQINAFMYTGHYFLFLSNKKIDFSITDIYESSQYVDITRSGNDWNKLVEFFHTNGCIPIQKWVGSNEVSVRLFLNEKLDLV
ncbi:hypothetical protein OZX61_02240 [Acinetobacter sp. ESL0695]|uniref:hypothetical protein n=1 Tax=Acinetobacter sp. ESL0695 TaxID=2983215 RepID=UPI0023F31375|nr:hypothetical protein [Acinetobacter sp. ESL0695]WEV49329.1 hypothetical protein OZX61_02240 [Acinetobacter sp. ESL0695]